MFSLCQGKGSLQTLRCGRSTGKAKDETARRAQARKTKQRTDAVKGAKGTISLAQAKDVVPGPNCNAKEFVGINQE